MQIEFLNKINRLYRVLVPFSNKFNYPVLFTQKNNLEKVNSLKKINKTAFFFENKLNKIIKLY